VRSKLCGVYSEGDIRERSLLQNVVLLKLGNNLKRSLNVQDENETSVFNRNCEQT